MIVASHSRKYQNRPHQLSSLVHHSRQLHLTCPKRTHLTALRLGCALLASVPVAGQAQPSAPGASAGLTIHGTVRSSTGAPLSQVQIAAADASGRSQTGSTDAAGTFRVAVPGAGRFTVQARAVGYRPSTTAVSVTASGSSELAITLTPVQVLGSVQVIGTDAAPSALHPGASDVAGAVSVLSGDQISREQVNFAQELLRKVPGVYRAEFNQGVVAGDIGIRGFNSESEIASTKLLIDGIPANTNSGVSEMNALFPLEISRMEIVRGTNDPRFGMFNLAGNISVATPRGGSYLTTRLQGGSFDTRELQLLAAFEQRGFSQTLFAGLRESRGYRANAESDKWSVSGKWFYRAPTDRVTIGVIGRSHRLSTAAPGYLSLAESRSTPSASPSFSNADGGTIATDHGSLHVDIQQTRTLAWSARAYGQRFARVRFVRFTAAGAQQERVEDERQQGAIGTVTWRPAALASRNVVLTGGADLQQQDNLQSRYRTSDRVRQATLRDFDFTLDNTGGFVQLSAAPLPRLELAAGLRADRFSGTFRNVLTNSTLPIIEYGWIPQPKASASLRLTDRLSTYANYGRAFQIGSGVATYGTQPLNPSRNDGVEFGVVSAPITAVSLRAGMWQQKASDEVRLKFDNSGDSENIGRTERRGVDVEATVRLRSHISLWAAGTSQRAVLTEPGLTNATSKGKRLNHVPAWTAKYGADWSPRVGLTLSFWSYMQGQYQITPQNDRGTWGDIRTVNSDISWRYRALAVGVGVTNLFDRYSEYVFFDGAQTLHSPAASRALFLTLTVDR
jgi:iron complex outermembrane recepter protein